jgi:hypothetical protein
LIAVNVTQSWPKAKTSLEQEQAMAGNWTLRETINRADVEQFGDIVIASKRNRVVAVRSIVRVRESDEPGRVSFDLAPADEPWDALVGRATPSQLSWRRGEVWPIKAAPTSDIEMPGDLDSQRSPETITLGRFTITAVGNSELVIHAPRGTSVKTVSAY